jgi:CHAT domain-containing protein/tetratricopeptide (TPR) repeat protein
MGKSSELKGFLLKVEDMIRRGEFREADRVLKTFVKELPETPPTLKPGRRELEGCFWDSDEFIKFVEDNRATLQQSLIWNEMPSSKAFYWLAYIAYEWGDLPQALHYINEGLALDPARPQMLCEKAEILKGLRQFDASLECYREVAASKGWVPDKQRARAHRGLGFVLIELRKLDEAEAALHESLKIEPGNETALHELRYIEDLRAFIGKNASKGEAATTSDLRRDAARSLAEADQIVEAEYEKGLERPAAGKPRAVRPDEPAGIALAKYEKALRLWRKAGDFAGQAQTVFAMGRLYAALWDIGRVIECYHEAANLWNQAGGHEADEALARYKIGSLYLRLAQGNDELLSEALHYLENALRLNQKAGATEGVAATLSELGELHEARGEYHKAIGYFEQLLEVTPSAGGDGRDAMVLIRIASNYGRLGEMEFAISYYTRVLELAQAAGDKELEALTRNNVASIHARMGHFDETLRHLSKGLEAAEAVGARHLLAPTLNAIGAAYYMSGAKHESFRFYERSLELRRELKDRRGEAATLSNMGLLYVDLSSWDAARDCFRRALAISREDKNEAGEANTLHTLGEVCYRGQLLEQARQSLEDALKIWERLKDLGAQARTLAYLAYTYRDLGDFNLSLKTIERVLAITETLRGKVYNPDWRASVLAVNSNVYEFYVDLLVRLGRHADAFAANERARARSLLDMLTEAGVDIRQGGDPALLRREQELGQLISAKEQDRADASDAGVPPMYLAQLDGLLDDLRAQLQLTRSQLRASSPRYAALTQPRWPNLGEIQGLLDEGTLLLEYALGYERSHLWIVSRDAMEYQGLPGRKEIEADAGRLYGLLSVPIHFDEGSHGEKAAAALLSLSRKVLAPAAAALSAARRVVVVSDGALQYVPFAALAVPASFENDQPQPLILDYEVVCLPSASTLAALRREGKNRRPAPRSVAVFADPVFDRDDERVVRKDKDEAEAMNGSCMAPASAGPPLDFSLLPHATLRLSAEEVGLRSQGGIQRLRGTRDEATAIFSLIGKDDGLMALDFEAGRAKVISTDLTQYRVVHFATHGMINSAHPDRSGIILSLVNEYGEPQNGYLRLHDIYNLKLSAELVVLSACQTALGKEVRGEGLVGLTRGFIYAGSRRVVASLWKVDDNATAELMKMFYEHVRRNKHPSAALRDAQIEMLRHNSWGKTPYYWAAFVIQGEWT